MKLIAGLTLYCLLFLAAIALLLFRRKRERREKPPVNFQLLRAPGDSLLRRIREFNENLPFWMVLSPLAPVIIGLLLSVIVFQLPPTTQVSGFIVVATITMAGIVASAVVFYRRLLRHSSDSVGYLGERQVGEHLQPLLADGYYVFHDVPAQGTGGAFNLDHVTIGPTGVTVIETKTRRKGRARPGFKEHVVFYDGSQLSWPWGEDRHGLHQATNEATWLHEWIRQRTGLDIEVTPILALPGWWVEKKGRGPVLVENSKNLPTAVRGNGTRSLSSESIDLLVRQLDGLCPM